MSSVRYLENQVLSTDPIGLVVLLYEGAARAIRQARDFLLDGKIQERSNCITKAMLLVAELQGSLDLERGGEIAHSLAELYAFIQERLIAANAEQNVTALDEALSVVIVLLEGWKEIAIEPPAGIPLPEGPVVTAGSAAWTL